MIKKSDLKLVKTDSEVLINPPKRFDFEGDIVPQMLSNMMIDRMKELGGIGLSANQVGLDIRMFVMGHGETLYTIFNPEIITTSNDLVSLDEGCLSFPGVYLKISRPSSVYVRFQNVKGERREETLSGLTARIFLHEYDHMIGVTFKERVSKLKWNLAYNRMIKRTKKIIRMGVQKQLVNIANQVKEQNDNDSARVY
jgi:peptide deformylase